MLKYQIFYEIAIEGDVIYHSTQFYRYGELHRIKYPALIWSDGEINWLEYGKFIKFTYVDISNS